MPQSPYDPRALLEAQIRMAQEEDRRAQIALRGDMSGTMGRVNPIVGSQANEASRRLMQLQNQLGALGGGGGGAGGAAGGPGDDEVDAAKKRAFGLAEERLSDLKGDGLDNAMRDQLMRRINGQDQPFDRTTIDALLTGQAGQAAQVERNQREQLGAGDINDPAYRSRMAEIQAMRQQSGQAANLNINQQAHRANYDARGQAINAGSAFNRSRQAQITDAANRVIDLNSRVFATDQAGGGPAGGGGFAMSQPMQRAAASQAFAGAQRPAPLPQAQPQAQAQPAQPVQAQARPMKPPVAFGPPQAGGPTTIWDATGIRAPAPLAPSTAYDEMDALYGGVDRSGNRADPWAFDWKQPR